MKTGTSFQLHVQFYYLNNLDEFKFDNTYIVNLRSSEKKNRIDCEKSLPDLKNCKKHQTSMVFHFTDQTHLAFDSMIYDGKTKSLIMIQITKNENHNLKFTQLNGVIKLKADKAQTQFKNVPKKYYDFFKTICDEDLVEHYYFQWLTSEKFPKLIEKIGKKLKTIKNLKFKNSSYYDPLLEQIAKQKAI